MRYSRVLLIFGNKNPIWLKASSTVTIDLPDQTGTAPLVVTFADDAVVNVAPVCKPVASAAMGNLFDAQGVGTSQQVTPYTGTVELSITAVNHQSLTVARTDGGGTAWTNLQIYCTGTCWGVLFFFGIGERRDLLLLLLFC